MKVFRAFAPPIVLAVLTAAALGAQNDEPVTKVRDERLLADRGVKLDSESLAFAVQEKNVAIAAAAIRMAPHVSKSAALTASLINIANDADATLAAAASDSLRKMGENGWIPVAIARLQTEPLPLHRLQFARLLAQAGRGDGWPIVLDMVTDPDRALEAISSAAVFDGLTDGTGRKIDVSFELQNVRARVPIECLFYLDLEMVKLAERRKRE
jgi:hypothetical protein